MALKDFEDFKQPALQAYVENVPTAQEHRLAKVFPGVQVDDMNSAYNIENNTKIVAGSIVGFNAGTPVRTKGAAQQALAKLTKIAHAYHLDEQELYKLKNPRQGGELQRTLDNILLSVGDLAQGVDDTVEYLRAGIAYRGKFDWKDTRDNVNVSFELERPEGNDMTISEVWSNAETSTPLDDIEKAIAQYEETNNGQAPAYIVMNPKTYSAFKRSEQVKKEFANGGAVPRALTDNDIQTMFEANNYPVLEIDKAVTNIENEDGTIETHKNLEDGKVVLHAEVLGSTLEGPALESNFQHGKFSYAVVSQDPIGEKVIVGEVTLPVLQNYNGTVTMTVL